ncbi:Rieske 2Fe-2S domain-containing protein [Motilibacter aurantiacus]|uniref:Rieske 2Fe-2S domain-containing protein n=1 Tax=Motilibacter aurantiacus TaxID=2714955 RepID=UPI001E3636DF|nr:Rieske (2Fe-2S) protein [Motilibacter aurantiacus]
MIGRSSGLPGPLQSAIERGMHAIEEAALLDKVARPLSEAVHAVGEKQARIADLLHGVPVGHPLHPALVLVPVGTWTSAAVLDLVPRTGPAVPVLIATGIASAAPAAAAGLVDWAELHPQQQRVGLVHAVANTAGLALYAASLAARLRGRRAAGRALSYAGFGAVMAGGFLGGHLSYRQAAGANHVEDVPHLVTPGWHDLCAIDDLPDGRPVRRLVGEAPVVAVRRGKSIDVLADKCSHLSGPLHEGRVHDVDGEACITCPWHGSTFRLDDGDVVAGPATAPQPSFDVRVEAGRVQVRLPGAG